MENAAEALKLSGWVLIFIVALSMCINAFGEARQAMDAILQYNDKEYYYTYVDEQGGQTSRIVGCESIIPTIYRAYKENYKIIFPDDYVLYTRKVNGENVEINYIDLEQETIGNQEDAELFIKTILYGSTAATQANEKEHFPDIEFKDKDHSLYAKIQNATYTEELGEYYQEEIGATEKIKIADVNKTKKRVITYKEE